MQAHLRQTFILSLRQLVYLGVGLTFSQAHLDISTCDRHDLSRTRAAYKSFPAQSTACGRVLMCRPSRIAWPGNRKIQPSSKTILHTIIKLGLLKIGKKKLILTSYPSPWLHLIPIIEHIDTKSEADELSHAASSSKVKPHIRCPFSLILYILLVFLLHLKFLAQLGNNLLGPSGFCLKLLLISYD